MSCNIVISWLGVLDTLGLKPASRVLPTSLACPLCQKGALAVYHDSAYGGAWGSCSNCAFVGDCVELAAKIWAVSPRDAWLRLALSGVINANPALAASYAEMCAERSVFETLWRAGLNDFDLARVHMPLPTQRDAPYQWRRLVRLGRRTELRKSRFGALRHLPEIPALWREFAMLALEDLPGRPRGFLCYRNGETRLSLDSACQSTLLLFSSAVADSAYQHLVITDDLTAALQLQLQSLRESKKMAPVCGIQPGAVQSQLWRQIRKQLVFWAKQPNPAIFREAAACDGLVASGKWPGGLTVAKQSLQLLQNAQPWESALTSYLLQQSEAAAAAFLGAVGLSRDRLAVFIEDAPVRLAKLLRPLIPTAADSVFFGGREFVRRGTEIFVKRNGGEMRISDATVLVHKIIEDADHIYEGEILAGHRAFRFRVRESAFSNNPYSWLRTECWRRGIACPFVQQAYKHHLFELGELFGHATFVPLLPPAGWSHELNGLVLGNWVVHKGGTVDDRTFVRTARSPVADIPAPTVPLSMAAIEAVSNMCGGSAFWAVLATVASAAIAPVTGRRPKDLVLVGDGARLIGGLTARYCDCARVLMAREISKRLPECLQQSAAANWPLLVFADQARTNLRTWLKPDTHVTAIYRTQRDISGFGILLDEDCDLVDLADTRGAQDWQHFAADVLPAYLRDLAARDFALPLSDQPTHEVLADMQAWWRRIGGRTSSRNRYFWEKTKWVHCLRRLLMLCRARMTSISYGFGNFVSDSKIVIETDGHHMYFDPERFRTVMANRVRLNMARLGAGLRRAGVLLSKPDDKIWALPISFCDEVRTAHGHRRIQ